MIAATTWGKGFRSAYLLVGTGSAIGLTLYLLTPASPALSRAMCWAIFVGAWVSVVLAWRRHRPYLRVGTPAHAVLAFGVCIELTVAMIALTGHISQPSLQEQERKRDYLTLETAIRRQDVEGVKAALRLPESLDFLAAKPGWDRQMRLNIANPLELAVATDNPAIVTALLRHGASSYAPYTPDDNDGFKTYDSIPLSIAAAHGNIPIMELLLKQGASVNDDEGNSEALWRAVGANRVGAVTLLLEHGANPDSCRPYSLDKQWPVLRLARSQGHVGDRVALLLLNAKAKK